MAGQELHPAQAHELDGHDAGEGTDGRPDEPGDPTEPPIHAATVPAGSA
jgi:hypothetical protein